MQPSVRLASHVGNYGGGEVSGWTYGGHPEENKDARAIVTLVDEGMVWVGIRAWNHQGKYWQNGNEPERAKILAWQTLPEPAKKRWVRGFLIGNEEYVEHEPADPPNR